MVKPIVLVDIDGVIADSVTVTLKKINAEQKTSLQYKDIVEYNPIIGNVSFGVTVDELMSSPEYIRECRPYPGVASALLTIHEKYRIGIVTKRPVVGQGVTMVWLERHSIPFDLFFSDRYGKREDYPGEVLVDDNVKNLQRWPRTAILFSQPWNADCDDARLIKKSSWIDVRNYLCGGTI